MMLQNTKLAVGCDPQILFQIQRLGEVVELEPNSTLFQSGDMPDYMYIVISGEIFVKQEKSDFVIGAGDFLGEVGYFASTDRTGACEVGLTPTKVWRINRRLIYEELDTETTILMAHFLLALAPHIHIRLLTKSGCVNGALRYTINKDQEVTYICDHDHRAIKSLALHLRGEDDWASAAAVWELVSHLPFRFGHWNLYASETLEVGFGTTTSKANLQVALFRALGMEAGYATIEVPGDFYDALKPPGLRINRPNAVSTLHDFCVVRLDNRWVPCDAAFTKEALQLLAEFRPSFSNLICRSFKKDRGISLSSALQGEPKASNVTKVLHSICPDMDPGNSETMNILLDKVQGPMYPLPIWVPAVQNLLTYNPHIAYLKALSNIVCDLNRFLKLIDRDGPTQNEHFIL